MRKEILLVIVALSILMMSSYAMAFKPDSPPGLSKEKNANAPGQFKKTIEFESQKHFVNEIHSIISSGLDQREVSPSGLIGQVNEFLLENEEEIEELLPPEAIITWATPVYKNTAVLFYADASYDPDGGDIVLIEWDWNGNGYYEISNINPYPGAYIKTGTYYIGLRVTDDEGQIGTAFETVTVIE